MMNISEDRKAVLRTGCNLEDIVFSMKLLSDNVDVVKSKDMFSEKKTYKAFINSEAVYTSYDAWEALGNAVAILTMHEVGAAGEAKIIINKFGTTEME